MRAGLVLTVIMLGGTAQAEPRTTSMHVGGFGLMELDESHDDEEIVPMESAGGVRMTLAWEQPAPAYPDKRGYRYGAALVPELIAGALMLEDHADGMIGAGIRGELQIVQREGGLLRINSKSALYLAGRGMVIGKDRDVILEAVFGDHLSFNNHPFRLGFEFGFTRRVSDVMDHDRVGFMTQFYLGWSPR